MSKGKLVAASVFCTLLNSAEVDAMNEWRSDGNQSNQNFSQISTEKTDDYWTRVGDTSDNMVGSVLHELCVSFGLSESSSNGAEGGNVETMASRAAADFGYEGAFAESFKEDVRNQFLEKVSQVYSKLENTGN